MPIAAVRMIRHADHVLVRGLRRYAHLPRRIAAAVAVVVLAVVIAAVANNVVLQGTLALVDQAFSGVNDQTYPGVVQPQEPTRSGSPGSLTPWATLGKEGRQFVAGRPHAAELVGRLRAARDAPRSAPTSGSSRRPTRRHAPTWPSPSSTARARSPARWSR